MMEKMAWQTGPCNGREDRHRAVSPCHLSIILVSNPGNQDMIAAGTADRPCLGPETVTEQKVAVPYIYLARTVVWTKSPNSARPGNMIISKGGQNEQPFR
jgi:hypothetical protein